ncbi:helix-turn-helix transcriptional regulator [Actinoplanes xinjiangensis]|uniref:helix-turn-helix transcriptional regulator n=1 Tax=Actinoplanes xinjiangensis TaxID=512350 RepID=UPI0034261BC8
MPTVTSLDRVRLRLYGAHEIRLHFGGISRQRVYQLTSRTDFPEPVADLAQGKVWLADEVEAWRAARQAVIVKHRRQ